MLISFSTLVLASQLIVTVADNVPKFNIERGCKVESNAIGLGVQSVESCVLDEQKALDQLQTQWSQFTPSDRALCTSETTQSAGVPSSYVELLTCLQGQMLARNGNK